MRRDAECNCGVEGFLLPAHRDVKDRITQVQQTRVNARYFVTNDQDGRACGLGIREWEDLYCTWIILQRENFPAIPLQAFDESYCIPVMGPRDRILRAQRSLCHRFVVRRGSDSAKICVREAKAIRAPQDGTRIPGRADVVKKDRGYFVVLFRFYPSLDWFTAGCFEEILSGFTGQLSA